MLHGRAGLPSDSEAQLATGVQVLYSLSQSFEITRFIVSCRTIFAMKKEKVTW